MAGFLDTSVEGFLRRKSRVSLDCLRSDYLLIPLAIGRILSLAVVRLKFPLSGKFLEGILLTVKIPTNPKTICQLSYLWDRRPFS